MIFLRNKYNVIEGADQFVLIEGRACKSDMPAYTKKHMETRSSASASHGRSSEKAAATAVLFFKIIAEWRAPSAIPTCSSSACHT